MRKKREPKILFYDVETLPNIIYSWGIYDQTALDIVEEWKLLCFAYKWFGEKKVTCVSRRHFKDNTEGAVVRELHRILEQADIVVTHNGISFDNKKANAKFAEWGLPPVKPAQQVDTKVLASGHFAFTSNKLDNLGRTLKVGRKVKKMDFSVWLGCMNYLKNRRLPVSDFVQMEKYNKQDVLLLEKVYLKLRPWSVRHPNVAQISEKLASCPKCGGSKLKSKGFKYTTRCVYRQYQCSDCGGYCKGESLSVPKNKFSSLT